MKKISILIFIICFVACSKDSEIEKSSRTKLVSIEHKYRDRTWVENYSYSPTGGLSSIEDLSPGGRKYEIGYQNNLIKEVYTYRMDENKLIFRDSVVYNPNKTIQAIYNFSINLGPNLPLARIFEFEYDSQNRLSKSSKYRVASEEYSSIEKYWWSENNIEKVESYRGEELRHESFFTYDDKINYRKGLPSAISNPILWSENNVIEMHWVDYTGLDDRICNPCTWEYEYNLDNKPVSIISNVGKKLFLMYE